MGQTGKQVISMRKVFLYGCLLLMLNACGVAPSKLTVSDVSYQCIRSPRKDLAKTVPANARISIIASVSPTTGAVNFYVKNLTSAVMSIDKTKSFYVSGQGGVSQSFYNPNIQVNTTSTTTTRGASGAFDLGAAAAVLGIGGNAGILLSGTTIGTNNSVGTTASTSTYNIDQPIISLAPNSFMQIGESYTLTGVGINYLKNLNAKQVGKRVVSSEDQGGERLFPFSITITYKIEGDKNYKTFTSSYYVSDVIKVPISGGQTNAALRNILSMKKNATSELWYLFYLSNGDSYSNGFLYDYE